MNTLTTLTLSLALLLCNACGFQLRGTDSEFASKARVFVDAAPDSTLKEELNNVLSDRSFAVVDNRDLANVLLRVADEQQTQRIVSVQRTGRVSEFELAHSVNIQVTQSDIATLPPQTRTQTNTLIKTETPQTDTTVPVTSPEQVTNRVEVIREYTYDERGVLGKEDEADILRKEMRRELALQIVLRAVATMASSTASR